MNIFNMAYNNLKNNLNLYFIYIFSTIVFIIFHYNFESIKLNPNISKLAENSIYVDSLSKLSSNMIIIFAGFFLWYSNSFFMKQRKNEIALYKLMGINNFKIAGIFFIEIIYISLISIMSGIGIGIILEKLFFMLLNRIAMFGINIAYFFSIKAALRSALVFFILFSLIVLNSYISIVKSKIIDLFKNSKEEEIPKLNIPLSLISVFLIAIGYYFGSTWIHFKENVIFAMILAVFGVVLGTFLLYKALIFALLTQIFNKNNILYRGTNIVSFSNFIFNIKKKYKMLSILTILTTIIITALGTVVTIKLAGERKFTKEVVYSISYTDIDKTSNQEIEHLIKSEGYNINKKLKKNYLMIDNKIPEFKIYYNSYAVISESSFNDAIQNIEKNELKNIKTISKLSSDTFYFVESPSVVMGCFNEKTNNSIVIADKQLKLKNAFFIPIFGKSMDYPILVVSDQNYNIFSKKLEQHTFYGYKINNQENSIELLKKIDEKFNPNNFYGYEIAMLSKFNFAGTFFFFGLFTSIVYIIATGSILYFKLLSEAITDKDKFVILSKIGITNYEIKDIIKKQVGITFLLPLIIGSLHGVVAIKTLKKLVQYNMSIPIISSILVFSMIYGIFFIITSKKYHKIIVS